MAIFKYGTQEAMPEGYTRIRDILGGMGYGTDKVGYNPQTKNPILMGNELDASKFILGSDQSYYATPDIVNPMLSGMGLMTSSSQGAQPYASPYDKQIEDIVTKILNRPSFQFNENDAGYQQATKDIQNKVMLDFAKRNMLYSPATGEAVSEGIANARPAYEQAQYAMYQDEGTNLNNMLNVLLNLDQRSYGMYKDAVDNSYKEWEKNRTVRLDQLDAQYKQMDYAYKKLDEMEVADNEVASILGIPVGTKSQAAKQRAEELKNKIDMMKLDEETKIREEQRSLSNEKALIAYRDSLDKKKAEEEEGTPEQQSYFNEFLNMYLNSQDSTYKWANDPNIALQNVLSRRTQHEQLLGTPLYNKLVDTLKQYSSVSAKTEPAEPTATEQKKADEVKLQAIIDTYPTLEEKAQWIKDNKLNIIGTFGKSYYDSLASDNGITE